MPRLENHNSNAPWSVCLLLALMMIYIPEKNKNSSTQCVVKEIGWVPMEALRAFLIMWHNGYLSKGSLCMQNPNSSKHGYILTWGRPHDGAETHE